MTTRRESMLAHGLLLAVVMVWGATFPLVKASLRDCSPLLFNQLRMLLAFAVLAAVHWKSWRQMSRKAWVAGAVAGFFLAMGYELQTAGLALTTPSNSAFLTGTIVVLVPLLSLLPFLRRMGVKAPGWSAAPGVVCAFAGILLLTIPAGSSMGRVNRGDILSFLCAVAFACHFLTLDRTSKHVPTAHLATLQIGFCALTMCVSTPLVEHPFYHPTALLWVTLGVCAVLATAAAFTIQSWAQKHLAPTHTALMLSLEPVFAWVVSLLFFGEEFALRSTLGACLIFAGILLAEMLGQVPVDGAGAPAG